MDIIFIFIVYDIGVIEWSRRVLAKVPEAERAKTV